MSRSTARPTVVAPRPLGSRLPGHPRRLRGWLALALLLTLALPDWGRAVDPAFTLVIDTTLAGSSASNQFTLPLVANFTYACSVDWGDGTTSAITTATDPALTHTYTAPGSQTVRITEQSTGGFPALRFSFNGDRLKVMEISNWGAVTWATMHETFAGCANLTITATDAATAQFQSITDFENAWADCASLTSFPVLDTSGGTNFSGTWAGCTGLTSFPVLDTSAGIDFSSAWNGCHHLTTFPLIDTGHATNLFAAWYGCFNLTAFPLLNTANVTSFDTAWYNCPRLTSFPALDTSAGTNFANGWSQCAGLAAFPLINTANGTTFSGAWVGCRNLTSFPLLDSSKVTNFSFAWSGCTGLTTFPGLNTAAGTRFSGTWRDCTGLTSFPTLDLGNLADGQDCFAGVALPIDVYSDLLNHLAAANANTSVVFSGGLSRYNAAAAAARTTLTGTQSWTITDGGSAATVTPSAPASSSGGSGCGLGANLGLMLSALLLGVRCLHSPGNRRAS